MPKLETDPKHTSETDYFSSMSRFSRVLLSLLSPGGPHPRLSILIYHRVLTQQDPLFPQEIDAQDFDLQMRLLKACFNIVPLSDAIRCLRHENLPPRAACITFDDGYADNAEVALPILQKYGIPATFFIATGFLNGGRMWNDTVIELVRRAPGDILDLSETDLGSFNIRTTQHRQQAIFSLLKKLKYLPFDARQAQIEQICSLVRVMLPNDLMMDSGQVRKLHSAGMEIGGHTVNHPILARLEHIAARDEIANGMATLENIIRGSVRLFAYPNGKPTQDYLSEHVEMVKNLGFSGAVSTAWGTARSGGDLYQLPRFTPWDKGRVRFMMRMAQNMLKGTRTI
jgi:peptidoglycan/xylan/chitin deacetylase (PgdA/CDA1 family)